MAKKSVPNEVDRIISTIRSGENQDVIMLLIPSHDNKNGPIKDQEIWAGAAMDLFAQLYTGATAFQTFAGVYMADGVILRDRPILIESYTNRDALEDKNNLLQLVDFMKRIGRETRQASVAVVINSTFHEIKDF